MSTNSKQTWLDAAIAPEDRPERLTAHDVAAADESMVAAGGDAALLLAAGGEQEIAGWYNSSREKEEAGLVERAITYLDAVRTGDDEYAYRAEETSP